MVKRKVLTRKALNVLSKGQIRVLKQYVGGGFSDRDIHSRLQRLGIGIKRQDLARHIRMIKALRQKFIVARLREYLQRMRRPMGLKQIAMIGTQAGRRVVKQASGTGRQLYKFVRDQMMEGGWDAKPHIISQ